MNETQFECLPLFERRIFVIEEDDALFCRMRRALEGAGAEVVGSLAHFPDMSVMLPAIHLDAAILDVDGEDTSLLDMSGALKHRAIPTIVVSAGHLPHSLRSIDSRRVLHKPFTSEELVQSIACMILPPDELLEPAIPRLEERNTP